MANFHLEFEPISRRQGRSPVRAATYQSREKLRDDYYGKTYYTYSSDIILHTEIMLPSYAPPELASRQTLWREVDRTEKQSNSRTARRAIGSLPNEKEFILADYIEIVREYVNENFISMGMCADIAIHQSRNSDDPMRNNMHVHILLTDRPINRGGFAAKKNRDWNDWRGTTLILMWRERWAEVQNRAYERKGLDDVRVSHKNYIEQGIFDREPKLYLSRKDMWLERNGIQTIRGDDNRAIEKRPQDREHNHVRSR
jgi:hypothetical protein